MGHAPYSIIVPDGFLPKAIIIFFGRTTGYLEKFVTSIRNETFSRPLFIPLQEHFSCRLDRVIFYPWSCNHSKKLYSPRRFRFWGYFRCFAIYIIAWSCASRLGSVCGRMRDILDMYLFLPKICIGAEGTGTIFLVLEKFL